MWIVLLVARLRLLGTEMLMFSANINENYFRFFSSTVREMTRGFYCAYHSHRQRKLNYIRREGPVLYEKRPLSTQNMVSFKTLP